ncbi:hypothetical protein [Aquimonas sp.]|jgi:hypothetical protein|uniref:hypothetical protein n=1 Tax=Aquimonas sp. TaxID=1872588 RepID=UPI0037C06B68
MSALILCATKNSRTQIQRRADPQTVWLTQLQMNDRRYPSKRNTCMPFKNPSEDGVLDANSVVKESLTTSKGLAGRATVKQSLTVALSLMGQATAEDSSAVGSAGAALAAAARRA